MTGFGINSSYFMHSDPQYNNKHKEEISEYNAEYYENNKEKWKDNDNDSKDKKEKESSEDKVKALLKKINGGSKKGGSGSSSKKSSSKSSSSSKKKEETEEEKKKREEEEAKANAEAEEEKKKNSEAAEKYKAVMEANAKYIEEQKKKKTVKHSAVYVGINSQPYFEHHGRLGMKWGKRNGPPYPLDYSKLSEEERAKDKARVKEEGDIESVGYKKNRSYFTDQEINEVINRYNLNTRINQLSAESAKMKAGKSKTDEFIEKMGKATEVGNKLANGIQAGTNVYNNVAKIMNALGDNDLPIIGQEKKKESKINKLSKKELDYYIDNIDKVQGTLNSSEVKELVQRMTQVNTITKERDSRAAAKAEAKATKEAAKAEKKRAADEAAYEKFQREREETERIKSGVHREGKAFYEEQRNNDVEHVTGEVVDAGHQWFNDYLALEDKRRR